MGNAKLCSNLYEAGPQAICDVRSCMQHRHAYGGSRMICQQTVVLLIAALSEDINYSLLESWRQCLQVAAHGSPLLTQNHRSRSTRELLWRGADEPVRRPISYG